MPNLHGLVYGSLYMDCKDKNDGHYSISLRGFGPGLEINATTAFVVTCPTVSKRRLDRKGSVNLGGAQISASAIGRVNVGLGLNFRGGSCFIAGVQYGLGASVKIGQLKIMKGSLRDNDIVGDAVGVH